MSQDLPNGAQRLLNELQHAVTEEDYVRAHAIHSGLIAATKKAPSASALRFIQLELQRIRADLADQQSNRMMQLKELGHKSKRASAYLQANDRGRFLG